MPAGEIPMLLPADDELSQQPSDFSKPAFAKNQNVRNHIQSNFSLPNQVEVSLNVYPAGAGKIKISAIAPEEYPWEGIYFNGIPIRIEAIPNEGFHSYSGIK